MNAEQIIKAAIEPMRQAAIEYSKGRAAAEVESAIRALDKTDWDLTPIVNQRLRFVRGNVGEYQRRQIAGQMFKAITAQDVKRINDLPSAVKRIRDYSIVPDYRLRDEDREEHFIEMSAKDAEQSFDAYAAKMVGKIGEDVMAAELKCGSGNVWTRSTLIVTRKDGSVEKWNTSMIVNFSVHGKMFNQFPTRKAK